MSSANGNRKASDLLIARLKERYAGDVPYNIAAIFAYRGELDECFAWLERAIKAQDGGLAEITNERLFLPARADARWQQLMQRLNRTSAALDAVAFNVRLPSIPAPGAPETSAR